MSTRAGDKLFIPMNKYEYKIAISGKKTIVGQIEKDSIWQAMKCVAEIADTHGLSAISMYVEKMKS